MHKLKTVLWDLDGTIADTELSGHRIAFNKAFKEHSVNWFWDEQTYINLLKYPGGKLRIKQYGLNLSSNLSDYEIERIHNTKKIYYDDIVSTGMIPLRPGIRRLTAQLSKLNVRQWIVTSSGSSSVNALINSKFKGSISPFNGFITSEDVTNLKPSPEPFLLGLSRCKSNPENTIVIEDSIAGLESARLAGIKCLVTLSPWLETPTEEFREANFIVNHLGDNQNDLKVFAGNLSTDIIDYNILKEILNS